ncbi:MAG: ArsA-related P-loop ATPase [Thermoanaerobaculia bacterium]|nr:ArsA-related P-loop ATPase [Thermoanaerobaculia bacterium]
MSLSESLPPLVVVVGSGGVGKTTLAAALGLGLAQEGEPTLVMTFDPSLRLKDALGVGESARDREVAVDAGPGVELAASLLDARGTFDRLIARYAPDDEARARILGNRYYHNLAGSLGGILEYMAVERLFEVARSGRYRRIVLDTPPTRQALDFLEAPQRIVGFLNSGVLKIALKRWFDDRGRLKPAAMLGPLGSRVERFLDEVVGLDLLRDMSEFFQAFAPLYSGFEERAAEVEKLLRGADTRFVLVAGPGEEKIPDALFFARKLGETGYGLGPLVVNRVHPRPDGAAPEGGEIDPSDGRQLLAWLGRRDHDGLAALKTLLPDHPLIAVPLLPSEPSDLASLSRLARRLAERLG